MEERSLIAVSLEDGRVLEVNFSGTWTVASDASNDLANTSRSLESIIAEASSASRVVLSARDLGSWDSKLVSGVFTLIKLLRAKKIDIDWSSLPLGLRKLIDLAFAVPASPGNIIGGNIMRDNVKSITPVHSSRLDVLHNSFEACGKFVFESYSAFLNVLDFIGKVVVALWRFVLAKAYLEWGEVSYFLADCGYRALPIVSLISVLVGLILAFIGALQLEQFGAQVYVANLVGIAMVREMGAMMSAIIMAGRTGAAFAAQLGTMQVNEEIDALETFGIDSTEFLVLPRLLALVAMMPILCLFADILGIGGGVLVMVGFHDISWTQYLTQTSGAIRLNDLWIGLGKSIVYGLIVALSGCYQGFNCGRSALGVGNATTRAVVVSIVLIIVWDAIAAVICAVLEI